MSQGKDRWREGRESEWHSTNPFSDFGPITARKYSQNMAQPKGEIINLFLVS
jgi:hypothetical protein